MAGEGQVQATEGVGSNRTGIPGLACEWLQCFPVPRAGAGKACGEADWARWAHGSAALAEQSGAAGVVDTHHVDRCGHLGYRTKAPRMGHLVGAQ